MLFQSDPRNPGSKALAGDYAVQQNTSDRSNTALNDCIDQTFKPQHIPWSAAWVTQRQLDHKVSELVAARDTADARLDQATANVLSALVYTQGKGSPVIDQYIPGGTLGITRRPFSKQLTEMEPYAQTIAAATDTVIPAAARTAFTETFAAARTAQADLALAEKEAVDAQRARAALDEAWMAAYKDYHRTVEFITKGDRELIKTWIKEIET